MYVGLQKPSLHQHLIVLFGGFILCLPPPCRAADSSYDSLNALINSTLDPTRYNLELRPVQDQLEPIIVNARFYLMSIVQIDDVDQKFSINGFLHLMWMDQRISWNPADYGGVGYFSTIPKSVWRPRMMLLNTLGNRDPFKDESSPVVAGYDGTVQWTPGGLFLGTCELNMVKYPFDEQSCILWICPMNHDNNSLTFKPSGDTFDLTFFSPNEGWELVSTDVRVVPLTLGDYVAEHISCPHFTFRIKRRPGFFLLNTLVPVQILSFLNTIVFIIPNDSGEKISYGITVLLSLSVFLTNVSGMVPPVSNNIPLISIYLFVLFICCSLSVVMSMVIVYFHHAGQTCEGEDPSLLVKVFGMGRRISPWNKDERDRGDNTSAPTMPPPKQRKISDLSLETAISNISSNSNSSSSNRSSSNNNDNSSSSDKRCKYFAKHLNRACFAISILLYIVVNTAFLTALQN